jgi:4-hydroxybenzoyl-CoA reductase subunit beta
MLLPEFTLQRPRSLEAAVKLAAEPGARLVAGGTGLLPNLRLGIGAPRMLVSLDGVSELSRIEPVNGEIRIGACVSLREISESRKLPAVLREAARSVAAPGHRAIATVGGNLCLDTRCLYYNQSEQWRRSNGYCLKHGGDTCHVAPQGKQCRAAYSGDLAPALMVLDAEVEVAGPAGSKTIPLKELYRDDGASCLALEPGEIVAAVRLPASSPGLRSAYAKVRARAAIDFPLAGVAIALAMQGRRLAHLRVALTGTNSKPFSLQGVDELLGERPLEALGAALAKLVQKQAGPMRTTNTAADYRRQAAAAAAARLVTRLAQGETS